MTSAVSTTKNNDGETVSSFTFWDGATEHKDIMTDEKVSLSKGDIFTYEENKDGSYTVTEVDNLLRTAIIAYNEKNGDIRFTDASLSDKGSNVNAEITKDPLSSASTAMTRPALRARCPPSPSRLISPVFTRPTPTM